MINHEKKFIFIHIPKCGGSSIEYTLFNDEIKKKYNSHKGKWPLGFMTKQETEQWMDGSLENSAQHKYLNEFDKKLQKQYFSFTFVRNPWSKCLSEFLYTKKITKVCENFSVFLLKKGFKKYHMEQQIDFINDNIDYIGRFENLQRDFNVVCDKIGIPRQQLPCKNKSEHKHYTEYYDEETKQIVAQKYAKDIEYFGYEFGK